MFNSKMWSSLIFIITITSYATTQTDVKSDSYSQSISKNVNTQSGIVRGKMASDGNYIAFLGIPYAEPPSGHLRFQAPQPSVPWSGVFDANRKVMCPQNGQGDEDCLIVNVFTPTSIVHGPLPVLVYIHGGSFIIGSGQTQGVEPLTNKNIIVVTMNYRLGALGFLSLGIKEAPGNAGLKDQVAALKWVRNNIANFGGDPNQVTLYGMSAGGSSTEFQILSTMANGLFHRAIIESGAAAAVWSTAFNPVRTAFDMAQYMGYPKNDTNIYRLLDFYKQKPAENLSIVNYEYYNSLIDGTFGFVPCVERSIHGIEPFITESPFDILTKGKFHKVPVMFSFAALEGLYLRSEEYYSTADYKDRMQSNFLDFVPGDLVFNTKEIKDEIAESIRYFYFGNKTIAENNIIHYLNYFGDYLIMHGLLNSVEIHSNDNNPVYLIEFKYKGKLGSYEKFYKYLNEAGHGDMIKYAILNKIIMDRRDELTVDRVSTVVSNFAKFGYPTPNQTAILPVLWPRADPHDVVYLQLDDDLQILNKPQWDRKLFWDHLYLRFRRKILPVDPGQL